MTPINIEPQQTKGVSMSEQWRATGAGSSYRAKINGRDGWCHETTLKSDTNHRRKRIRGYATTRQQAIDRHNAKLRQFFATGDLPQRTEPTIDKLASLWAQTGSNSANSTDRVQANIRNHIPSELRSTPTNRIDAGIIKQFFEKQLPEQASPSVQRNTYNALSAVLSWAYMEELIERNPLEKTRRPKYRPANAKPDHQNIDERQRLYYSILKWLKDTDNPNYTWVLFLSLGLRRSELCGIEWTSINEKTATLTIDRTFERVKNPVGTTPKTHPEITPGTKNKRDRSITLENPYYFELRKWKAKWQQPPEAWAKNQVFTKFHTDGTQHGRADTKLYEDWKKIITQYFEENGLTDRIEELYFSPHYIRKITATTLAAEGVSVQAAKEILGHMTDEMTEHYTHVLQPESREAVRGLGKHII